MSYLDADYLTNLSNVKGVYEYYKGLENELIHVIVFKVYDFRRINKTYGYSVGEEILEHIEEMLYDDIPVKNISRIMGDEFIVILDSKMKQEDVEKYVRKVFKEVSELDFGHQLCDEVTLCSGIAINQNVDQHLDVILAKCEGVLEKVKATGKNTYAIYDNLDDNHIINKKIEEEMEDALKNGEFKAYFQPKVNGVTNRLVGAEALVRWIHPKDGVRSPEVFIPLFEENGFIEKLDLFIFEEVCKVKQKLQGSAYGDIRISVNMSRAHIFQKDLPKILKVIADKYNVPTDELDIEITESVFINNKNELVMIVDQFREMGFHVSIDDFGSGYSALNMLYDISADVIKIDKEFLRMSKNSEKGRKILKNVINMCRDLKLDVITEGVETKEELEKVIGCGCQIIQGYYFSKPICEEDFLQFIYDIAQKEKDDVEFTFDGTLQSTNGNYNAVYIESKIEPKPMTYTDGIYKDTKAISLPGGDISRNAIFLPCDLISVESYMVSVWVRPHKLSKWDGIFYIKYEMGFVEMVGYTDEPGADLRVRDSKEVDGWYDIHARELYPERWIHMVFSYNAETETGKIYINGELDGELSGIPSLRYAKMIILGGDVFQRSTYADFCHLRVYRDIKGDKEVANLYKYYIDREDFIGEHH